MQIFQENAKNNVFDMISIEFSKNFYAKLFHINFYILLCHYLETRKNFSINFFEAFWAKKIFFRIFQENHRNQLKIIF